MARARRLGAGSRSARCACLVPYLPPLMPRSRVITPPQVEQPGSRAWLLSDLDPDVPTLLWLEAREISGRCRGDVLEM